MRSCENAIGVMTKLQTSLVAEETWVDGATEKLSVLPTATSALELDVSRNHISHTLSLSFFCFQIYIYMFTKQHQTTTTIKSHFIFSPCHSIYIYIWVSIACDQPLLPFFFAFLHSIRITVFLSTSFRTSTYSSTSQPFSLYRCAEQLSCLSNC